MTDMNDPFNDRAKLQTPSHAKLSDSRVIDNTASSVAMLAIILIAIMAIGKLIFGIMINSVALLSEGLHTFLDLFAASVSYYTVRVASEPADAEHRYGHGKIENIAGIAQAAFIFVPTIIIIYRAIVGIINLETVLTEGGSDVGAIVMGVTILINIFLAWRLLSVAKKFRSEAIRAAAYHQLNDLWTSVGVFVALAIIWIKPEWKILDPVVALAVTAISIWMAWELLRVSAASLVDRSAGKIVDDTIIDTLNRKKPLVRGYHNLRTRTAGVETMVDLHVEICGEMSFRDAHEITEDIESEIAGKLYRADVIIHADPCTESCQQCEIHQNRDNE